MPAVTQLTDAFPDGIVRIQRHGFEKPTSLVQGSDGAWHREPQSLFPLLEATSIVGAPSAALTRQGTELRKSIVRLALA